MLTIVGNRKRNAGGRSFAIVASRYNTRYVDGMLMAAVRELKQAGARKIKVVRVPGAFEIPVVAAKLLQTTPPFAAVICLGVVLRGDTAHARHIGDAVTASLARLQIQHGVPVIHQVLLLENEDQARVRCLSKTRNRGVEAALTALEMAHLMETLD